MPLNSTTLGTALYNKRAVFFNKTLEELLALYDDEEGIRRAACKADAEAIIEHFTENAIVPSTGLTSPSGPVGGVAQIQ